MGWGELGEGDKELKDFYRPLTLKAPKGRAAQTPDLSDKYNQLMIMVMCGNSSVNVGP